MQFKVRLVFGAILFAAFVLLAVNVQAGQLAALDLSMEQMVFHMGGPLSTMGFKIISAMGKWYTYAALSCVLFVVPRTRYGVGLPVGCVLVLAVGLNKALKLFFAIDRPELRRLTEASGYSFPSGHAMYGAAFVGMLAYLLCLYVNRGKVKIGVYAVSVLFLLFVGFSRVYLGAHHPTDVVAGYLAGLMVLQFSIPAEKLWSKTLGAKRRRRARRFPL